MGLCSLVLRSTAEEGARARPCYEFDLRTMEPMEQVQKFSHEADGSVRLLVAEGSNDPTTGITPRAAFALRPELVVCSAADATLRRGLADPVDRPRRGGRRSGRHPAARRRRAAPSRRMTTQPAAADKNSAFPPEMAFRRGADGHAARAGRVLRRCGGRSPRRSPAAHCGWRFARTGTPGCACASTRGGASPEDGGDHAAPGQIRRVPTRSIFPLPTAPVRAIQIETAGPAGSGDARLGLARARGRHSPARTFPLESVRPVDDGVDAAPGRGWPAGGPAADGGGIGVAPAGRGAARGRRSACLGRRRAGAGARRAGLGPGGGVAAAACFGWPKMGCPRAGSATRGRGGLFAVILAGTALGITAAQRESYYLDATVSADRPVIMQFYFDGGDGFLEENSTRVHVPAGPTPRGHAFPHHREPDRGPAL